MVSNAPPASFLSQPLLTPPRSPRGQQQEGGTTSTSKPPRPRSRPLVLSDGKAPNQDSSSTPHRPAPRPPPTPSSPSVGRKQQADVSPVSRQQPASPGRRATPTPNHSKPATPVSPQPSPPPNHQSAAELAGDHEESKSQFSMYLKMYNFKAFKDKMNKMPTNGKRGSGGSAQARKSPS